MELDRGRFVVSSALATTQGMARLLELRIIKLRANKARQQGVVELAMQIYNKGFDDGEFIQPYQAF